MDLKLKEKLFLICGATSGLGRGTALNLLSEGAKIIAVARNTEKLDELASLYKSQVIPFPGDISDESVIEELFSLPEINTLQGALINAAGPPAMKFEETTISDWDSAYKTLVRWKVILTGKLLPIFKKNHYGRLLYIESAAVKQPIENLILSNSLRMAVVGMVKSIALDLAGENITLNVLAPGYHETQAVERVVRKRAENHGISYEEAMKGITSGIPSGKMGDPQDFGSLAAWFFSSHSAYITGQTISIDGGVIRYVFG